eukprot:scaffold8271_cov90-Isochrysis_galbana.AAC.2
MPPSTDGGGLPHLPQRPLLPPVAQPLHEQLAMQRKPVSVGLKGSKGLGKSQRQIRYPLRIARGLEDETPRMHAHGPPCARVGSRRERRGELVLDQLH